MARASAGRRVPEANRVLVFEDHRDTLLLTQRVMTEAGFDVAAFPDADEALLAAESEELDAALLDIVPERGTTTGLDVAAAIKRRAICIF